MLLCFFFRTLARVHPGITKYHCASHEVESTSLLAAIRSGYTSDFGIYFDLNRCGRGSVRIWSGRSDRLNSKPGIFYFCDLGPN